MNKALPHLSDRCVHNAHVDDSRVELTLVFHAFDFARDNRSGNGEGEIEHTDFEKPNRQEQRSCVVISNAAMPKVWERSRRGRKLLQILRNQANRIA